MTEEKIKILLVDDVPANLVALEGVLRPLNLELLKANSGSEAIGQLLRHQEIALILMDVQMPEMDGFETAEFIRQDDDSCHIPIIFVTAISTEDQYIFKGYQAGAVDYLFKPVDSDVLLSKVRVFVALHQQKLETERALREVERIQNSRTLLLDNAYEGIIGVDEDLNINFANVAALSLLKYSLNELEGSNFKKIAAPLLSQKQWLDSSIVKIASSAARQHLDDWKFTDRENNEFPVEFTQVTIVENRRVVGGVILFRDISERIEAQKRLLKMAQHDSLTGIANRSLFWNYLGKSIANSKRHKIPFGLLYIDLDRFKQVNDSFGHLAGDLLLTKTAERIMDALREEDFVARLGGDEFAVIATYVNTPEIAGELASRIIYVLEQAFDILDQEVYIGASIGVALFPEHGDDIKTLTNNADTAMYAAKNKGRNNFQFFNEEMQQTAEKHLNLARQIEKAIESDDIRFHADCYTLLSTIDDLSKTHDVFALRLSPRWQKHPELSPSLIVSSAESSRSTQQLRKNLLAQLNYKILNVLKSRNFECPIFINFELSANHLQMKVISSYILPALLDFDFPLDHLVIEVSELVVNEKPQAAIEELSVLSDSGIGICLSDVGEGMTNMQLVSQLPISVFRLSSAVFRRIGEQGVEEMVRSIGAVAKSRKIELIVSPVDSEEKLRLLSSIDCRFVGSPTLHFSKSYNDFFGCS